jgi:hypothetical protein
MNTRLSKIEIVHKEEWPIDDEVKWVGGTSHM